MKKSLLAGAAALALTAGMAQADGHMPFAEGDGAFNWDSYAAFADGAPDLSGQSLTISGPWLSPEADRFDILLNYFEAVTGVDASYTGSAKVLDDVSIEVPRGHTVAIVGLLFCLCDCCLWRCILGVILLVNLAATSYQARRPLQPYHHRPHQWWQSPLRPVRALPQ